MKIDKVQSDLIKWALKPAHLRKEQYMFNAESEDKVYVLTSYYFYIINKKQFLLNINKLTDKLPFNTNFITEAEGKATEIVPTGRHVSAKNGILIEFKKVKSINDAEDSVFNSYLDEKCLKKIVDKEFDTNYTFKATSRTGIVFIYYENKIIGGVCPVNYTEEG